MEQTNSPRGPSYAGTFGVILLALILFAISSWQSYTKRVQNEVLEQQMKKVGEDVQQIQKTIDTKVAQTTTTPSIYPDFDSRLTMAKLTVLSDFESWTPKATKDPSKTKRVIILEKGKIAKGYIYIRASLNGKPLTQWESVFLTMNFKGGHLFRPQSLPLPTGDVTELFYALNDIPYLPSVPYSEQRQPAHVDWSKYFNDKGRIVMDTFISSMRPAKIESIDLYYVCENGEDCLLKLGQ
ncbi:MAG: hypothetical protein PHC53_02710 [Patescibacteria group bacterium]|nr:hypothetical protein [Patescibacteria group bacterium]